MKYKLLFIIAFVLPTFVDAQSSYDLYIHSQNEFDNKNAPAFLKYSMEAYKRYGSFHPDLTFNLAKASVMNGKKRQCFHLLNELSILGIDYRAESDSAFLNVWENAQFKKIIKQTKKRSEIIASGFAYSFPERDLIPEGITYDPRQQKFYLSSIYKRKIISMNLNGSTSIFATEAQDGLYSTIGMKVDGARNCLWVMSSSIPEREQIGNQADSGKAAVYQYDLETRRLLHRYSIEDTHRHFFNDVVILAGGDVYLTDSEAGTIFKIDQNTKTISLWWKKEKFIFPNGITASSDQQFLFVAHWYGISRISIADTQEVVVSAKTKTALSGIDGLYFYDNSLIAIQNGVGYTSRIMKFELNKTYNRVLSATVLESGHPSYNIPTTGTIVDDEFYFIANSQLSSFNENGKIFSNDKLEPVYIRKLRLKD